MDKKKPEVKEKPPEVKEKPLFVIKVSGQVEIYPGDLDQVDDKDDCGSICKAIGWPKAAPTAPTPPPPSDDKPPKKKK
jgi:hypothetical protein